MADPVLGACELGDLYRVTYIQRLYGQRILNTLWYLTTDVPVMAPPDRWDFMSNFAASMTDPVSILTDMKLLQSSDLKYEECRINVYRNATDRFPYFSQLLTDSGSVADAANLSNIALSIEKRANPAATKPRTGIGRMQIGGVPSTKYAEGLFLDAYLADASALAGDLLNSVTDVGVTVVPALVTVGGVSGFTPHKIFGAAPKRTVRDMRRRTVGVGE